MNAPAAAQLFASVAVGDRIASTAGGDQGRQVGRVVKVWPARFEVEFPPIAQLIATPWRRTFRRSDGRSVGARSFTWAEAAHGAEGAEGAWQQQGMAALRQAGYAVSSQGANLIVRDPLHRSEGGQLVLCGYVDRTLAGGNMVTKFLYDRS